MIRYALACAHGHGFEGWFGSSEAYDEQVASGLVECPMCGAREVSKQIMAPAVAGAKKRDPAPAEPSQAMMAEAMSRVRRHVEENFDYLGDGFVDEARAIHQGRAEDRGIFGEASPAQVRELAEEGVRVAAMPPAPPKKSDIN
ncbi:MAG: DUF1178 family protein [Phenylobacterium sp.]|uniref:DUF1178 family protein n=1 Tax=Phenylobacterium sp. TaxID=1871053 RepID=UPI0027329699|nr:DUF1178 family protein [Phenylobacterium sp.]MDP3174494.1 DUF1178 family protein [Phenylobacterium sp.]